MGRNKTIPGPGITAMCLLIRRITLEPSSDIVTSFFFF